MRRNRETRRRNPWVIALGFALCLTLLGVASAQYFGGRGRGGFRGGGRGRRGYLTLPPRQIFPSNTFTFCRIQYDSDFNRPGGGWSTDYPDSDLNFSRRLGELTTIHVAYGDNGEPETAVIRLTDPELYHYPFIYMDEVGGLYFSQAEQEALRSYLLGGGFMMVDDFWGDAEYDNFRDEIQMVMPPDRYPIVDIPLTHDLFHIVFDVLAVPQIPSIGSYYDYQQTGITFERNHDYRETGDTNPHCRGIFDERGRLMVVIMHNTDLGDGWEQESANPGYFADFSVKRAYPMGINIVVYAMTH